MQPFEEPGGSQGPPSAATVVLTEETIALILFQSVRTLATEGGRGAESIEWATVVRCLQEDGLWDGWQHGCCHHTRIQQAKEHKAPTACHLTLEERIGAGEFLKRIGGNAAHLLALERSKREDEGSELEHQP